MVRVEKNTIADRKERHCSPGIFSADGTHRRESDHMYERSYSMPHGTCNFSTSSGDHLSHRIDSLDRGLGNNHACTRRSANSRPQPDERNPEAPQPVII